MEHRKVNWKYLLPDLKITHCRFAGSVDGGSAATYHVIICPDLMTPPPSSPSLHQGFPGGTDGKESTRNAGELGSIPGLGRSPEEGMATHFSILAWRIPWTEEPGEESDLNEWLSTAPPPRVFNTV